MPVRILLTLLLLTCAAGLSACDDALAILAGEPTSGSILATDEWTGNKSTAGTATMITARTPAEWDALWKMTGDNEPGPLPDGKMAVAVFIGQRFTSGFKVEIEEAEMIARSGAPEQPVVRWRELPPLAGHDGAKALISPWAIRLMTRSVLPPDFRKVS